VRLHSEIQTQPCLDVSPTIWSRGHHLICGEPNIFRDCQHHLDASAIPLSEATRLLFNRCRRPSCSFEEKLSSTTIRPGSQRAAFLGKTPISSDAIWPKRNSLWGMPVLAVHGKYHWSCRERNQRLMKLSLSEPPPQFSEIKKHHDARRGI